LRNLPEPEPLIDNVLDQGTTGLLYGKWGTLKSFIALDWAASVATGREWQGRGTVKRRVLYVAAEGAFGLKARVDAWEQGWHTQIAADGELEILPRPLNLTNAAEVRNLAALMRWGGYSFIVFDTVARCMVGGDENSAKDCGLVVDSLNRLRECTPDGRGVVMGVHHSGKDAKTLRGSSAFEGGVDTVYSASRDGAVVTLEREKRKDGPELDHHELRLDLISLNLGSYLSTGGWTNRRARTSCCPPLSTILSTPAQARLSCDSWPTCHPQHSTAPCLTCWNPATWSTKEPISARSTKRPRNESVHLVHLCPPSSQICPSTLGAW
jgi:hypothetical protein